MPTLFDDITAAGARQLLGISAFNLAALSVPDARMSAAGEPASGESATRTAASIQTNKAFVWHGDYFQEGAQGAFPGVLADASGETLEAVRAEFATLPALESIGRRKRRGVVGREPSWSYQPRVTSAGPGQEEEAQRIRQERLVAGADAAVTSFWETRGVHGITQAAVDSLNVTGEIALRIFPRQGAARNGQIKTQHTIEDALELMYVELLPDGFVRSYLDRATMRELLGYEYRETAIGPDGVTPLEYRRMVVTYLDEANFTVLRSWTNDEEDPRADALDLNGQLLIWRRTAQPLISRPLRELQNQLSKSITMMGHNNNLAGFLQLIATGLLPPGNWVKTTVEGKEEYAYVQDEDAEMGPGKMSFLQQAMVYDEKAGGWKFPTSSGLQRIEPVDPAYLIKSAEYLYLCMLRTADQDHTLMSGDAAASAVSRVESRAQFVWSLLEVKIVVEAMLRWLLETVLLLAVNLTVERVVIVERVGTGNVALRSLSSAGAAHIEHYKALRARVDVHASAGPLAPDEKRVVIEMYQAGLMDRETAIVYLGTEDVDAEVDALDNDPLRQMEMLEKQGAVFAQWAQVLDAENAILIATGAKTPLEVVQGLTDAQKPELAAVT